MNDDLSLPMGVRAATGQLLHEFVPAASLDSIIAEPTKIPSRVAVLGSVVTDPNDLSEAGWCLLFPGKKTATEVAAIKTALAPLIDLRKSQVNQATLFTTFEGDLGYQPNDTAKTWLARGPRRLDLRTVDPTAGVPYYVLLIGSPEEISFEFQYQLDCYWAVGRLYFDSIEGYKSYAEHAVKSETVPAPKTATFVATRHASDSATQGLHDFLALPLLNGDAKHPPVGAKQKFELDRLLAADATKPNLLHLLASKRPSLLFTGSHGLSFDITEPNQALKQGAILATGNAPLPAVATPITPDEYLCEKDLGDVDLQGMIHMFFACYNAGCPANDTYDRKDNGDPLPLMPKPIVSKLVQGLLSRGALAVIGHVDRAWTSSFFGSGRPQIQEFRQTLELLMSGTRVGQAMDQFNQRWSVLSDDLAEMLNNRQQPDLVPDQQLYECWKVRNDARNYLVLGDPAARLCV